ncbi:MAG: hypothetical protein HY689_15575 [Chloroflexi bacterium]|nr:hypothetical protein [Chloroflexota bacterium]
MDGLLRRWSLVRPRHPSRRRPGVRTVGEVRRWYLGLGVGAVWLAVLGVWLVPALPGATAAWAARDRDDPCPRTAPVTSFEVSLTNVPIFLNRFGDVIPEGRMYLLDENLGEARITYPNAANPFLPKDIIEPLVLRVNQGDCVEVTFTNRLHELPHLALQALQAEDPEEFAELLALPNADPDAVNELVLRRIFPLPGEVLRPQGTVTPDPREFAPAASEPDFEFDPDNAPAASMHFTGLSYNVRQSDGTAAGFNPNTTVPTGERITYRLFADQEGEFPFQDGADLGSTATGAPTFIGSNAFGAFGAIIVEPRRATWVDVNTGKPIKSGARAIIKLPNEPDFREHALFMHDEIEGEPGIVTRFCRGEDTPAGSACVDPNADQLAKLQAGTIPALGGGDANALVNGEVPVILAWFAFNYRSEPGFNREEVGCPARPATPDLPLPAPSCVGEETDLSSWPYGDPGGGDLVFRNYRGEPMQIRLFHGAEKETHTFHWHIHRWPFDPEDEGGLDDISEPEHHTTTTNPLDAQAISPGSHFSLIPEGGAGSAHDQKPATVGDIIFHCHLYPHFALGMWGLNRIHDVLEDGSRQLPDTTPILPLVPLEDFDYQPRNLGDRLPPEPTDEQPGFPFFVPGEFGFKGPKPPLGVPERQEDGVFPPTDLEKDAAQHNARKPGAFFLDPCPATWDDGTPTPLKVFEVAAIQIEKVYSPDLQWRNPQHRMYVLQEDKQAVLDGTREPEPFAPLLNVGDCVEFHLTNELPVVFGGTVFDRLQITNEVGIHQHMVQFDVLTADGTANGWNYDQGADFGQTIIYRDFVSAEVRTNNFHDHFYPAMQQDNGLFGGSTVHPAGCTFHDPTTGEPVRVGLIVDVRCERTEDYHKRKTDGKDFRSFHLFIEDHVPMFQPEDPANPNDDPFVTPFGVPIFPPPFPSSPDDYGVMGLNYRLEPFEARRNADPADLLSSRVHGDPFTPLLRAFAGDFVKFHLVALSFEESHGFNLHRWRWQFEPNDRGSNTIQAEHIGMLEYFTAEIPIDREEPNRKDLDLRDYLYYYGGAEDWFLGAWGIFRVVGCDPGDQAMAPWLPSLPPLQALPDNPVKQCKEPKISPEREVGEPCPVNRDGDITAPLRRFKVVAINKDIVYNHAGEHDPNGLMYVLAEDLDAVLSGEQPTEPLIIRANVGDCIEVELENRLDPAQMQPHCFEALEAGQLGFKDPFADPSVLTFPACLNDQPQTESEVPGFRPFPVSSRVSMNPKLVDYHIGSDGANVGFNPDSTAGPGETILYRWFAAEQTGLAAFQDRGDVQNHLHHGLYGAIVIEPEEAEYLHPATGKRLRSGQEAVIVGDRDRETYREYVVLMNSDLALFQANGFPVPDNTDLSLTPSQVEDDPEDQGEFSIGYRNEPWVHRFLANPDLSLIFSSEVHGDPATPLFRAYAGDRVHFWVAQAVGDPRSTGFTLHGHRWRHSPNDRHAQIRAVQGQFHPTVTYPVHLDPKVFGGAGGPQEFPGDYLYRSATLFRHLTGGQWGIFRVFDRKQPDLIELPNNRVKEDD